MSWQQDSHETRAQGLKLAFPTLDELRTELTEGLAAAFRLSGAGDLPAKLVDTAAREALEGHGLHHRLAETFGLQPLCSLISFDANSIQSFVFESEKIPVSSGASEILRSLNEEMGDPVAPSVARKGARLTDQLPGICGVVYSAGGGGILFAPGRAFQNGQGPEELAKAVQQHLEAKSRGLTFTVVAVLLYAWDFEPQHEDPGREDPPLPDQGYGLHRFVPVRGFRGALARAQIRLQEAKDRSRFQALPELKLPQKGLTAERCASCGLRPPTQVEAAEGKAVHENRTWCETCRGKRRAYKDRWGEAEDEDRGPATFEELATMVKRRRKYLAFLAVDGNSMGQVVRGVKSFLQLRAFSEATSRIYEHARQRVEEELRKGYLEKELPPRRERGETKPWPVDPARASLSLLSGGDEITLVLGAAMAPRVASLLIEAVEKGFREATEPGALLAQAFENDPDLLARLRDAGVGAGLVMAGARYPVRLLRQYANDLQKQAKKHTVTSGRRSGIAWALLTDSAALTEKLAIAQGPETDPEHFRRLLTRVRQAEARSLPASALQTLLSHRAQEDLELSCLGEAADRRSILDRLSAHFLAYQAARNEALWLWLEDALGTVTPATTLDFYEQQGGARILEQVLDLLSLEPFPKDPEPPQLQEEVT